MLLTLLKEEVNVSTPLSLTVNLTVLQRVLVLLIVFHWFGWCRAFLHSPPLRLYVCEGSGSVNLHQVGDFPPHSLVFLPH